MTAEQLRTLRDAHPFRPFTIHLADGRTLAVPHRDFVSLSPGGRIVIVYHADETFRIVDLYLVTELKVESPADSSGHAAPAN